MCDWLSEHKATEAREVKRRAEVYERRSRDHDRIHIDCGVNNNSGKRSYWLVRQESAVRLVFCQKALLSLVTPTSVASAQRNCLQALHWQPQVRS